MLSEEKAQSSIELLLLIGGAIIIAAVVGLYLKNAANELASSGEKLVE